MNTKVQPQSDNKDPSFKAIVYKLQTQDDYKKCYKPYRTLRNY